MQKIPRVNRALTPGKCDLKQVLDCVEDELESFVFWWLQINEANAPWFFFSKLKKAISDFLLESLAFGLNTVGTIIFRGAINWVFNSVCKNDNRAVWLKAICCKQIRFFDFLNIQTTTITLITNSAVEKTVAQNNLAFLERRLNYLGNNLRACSFV